MFHYLTVPPRRATTFTTDPNPTLSSTSPSRPLPPQSPSFPLSLALGLSNVAQSTSSSFTFQIGSQVFTTNKGFPDFGSLPREVREGIIEQALEGSKDLVVRDYGAPPATLPHMALSAPLRPSKHFSEHNPLDPSSPYYRSIVSEYTSKNGYPLSAWRWLGLSREWRRVLRRGGLWREVTLDRRGAYARFMKFIEDGSLDDVLPGMNSIRLDQGYDSPGDIYSIIRNPLLLNLRHLSILGNWPFSTNIYEPPVQLFQFGLQLVPPPPDRSIPAAPLALTTGNGEDVEIGTGGASMPVLIDEEEEKERLREKPEDRKRLDLFELGLPLDLATNATQRTHLALLRPKKLCITLIQPNATILTELKDLLKDKIECLSIRYMASVRGERGLIDPAMLVSDLMDNFTQVDLHLPALASSVFHRNYPGQIDQTTCFAQRVIDLITSDESGARQKRYSVTILTQDPLLNRQIPMGESPEDILWERQAEEHQEDEGEAVTVLFDSLTTKEERRQAAAASAAEEEDQFGTAEEETDQPYMNQPSPSRATARRGSVPTVQSRNAEAGSSADGRRSLDFTVESYGRQGSGKDKVKEKAKARVPNKESWERETNLNLFGGLIKLRMEAKKH